MSATAHFIATVTTKVLSQPELQDVFAETVALVVQKLLIQGSPASEEEQQQHGGDDDDNHMTRMQRKQKQALRLLGKCLLKLGESTESLSRDTEDDRSKDIDLAESHTRSTDTKKAQQEPELQQQDQEQGLHPEQEPDPEQELVENHTNLQVVTNAAPKEEETPQQDTPTSVDDNDDLGKVISPSFGTVETTGTVDEDSQEEPLVATWFYTYQYGME